MEQQETSSVYKFSNEWHEQIDVKYLRLRPIQVYYDYDYGNYLNQFIAHRESYRREEKIPSRSRAAYNGMKYREQSYSNTQYLVE